MTKRQHFVNTVAAYLFGWVIAQNIYNRVWHRAAQWEQEKKDIARRVVNELRKHESLTRFDPASSGRVPIDEGWW